MTARTDGEGNVMIHTAKIFCFMAALTLSMTQPVNASRNIRHLKGGGVVLQFTRNNEMINIKGQAKND